MIIDFITAIIRAFSEKNLRSGKGREFILKKITTLLLVACTYVLDMFILQNESANVIANSVISFYMINETIGIIENAKVIGLPIPKVLTEVLRNKNE